MFDRNGLVAAVAGALGLAGVALPAQAACFYNNSPYYEVWVKLDCGFLCNNTWKIGIGEYRCRGGTGGEFTVGLTEHLARFASKVDDHGYVAVVGKCRPEPTVRVQALSENHVVQYDRETTGIGHDCRW
ncbi:MAG TPA: hypothetical protein VD995_14660 [Azospirillum sp.]|nr:hypothetical protein [Azospirillum sp.]